MKRKISILIGGLCLLLFTGCGGDEKLNTFHDEMDNFYNSLAGTVNDLESIDPQSETAVDDMLTDLDAMAVLFSDLAAIEIPAEFESLSELPGEAADYMAEANRLYHDAYADGGYDDALAAAAGENYSRAMKRINYIAIILQGRLPDDDNIILISETEEPDWNGGEMQTVTESDAE